jgi:hypothetical protein
MTDHVLAGFDLVVDLSFDTIRDLVKSTPIPGSGLLLNPPFALNTTIVDPLGQGILDGNLGFTITDISLDLSEINDQSFLSIRLTSAETDIMSKLNKVLRITPGIDLLVEHVPIEFTTTQVVDENNKTVSLQVLSLNFQAATVSADITEEVGVRIKNELAGTPVSLFDVVQAIVNAIQQLAAQFLPMQLGKAFRVTPGIDGSLIPFVFERLEVRALPNNEGLSVLGGLFADRGSQAVSDKTVSALQTNFDVVAAGDNLAISVSEHAFNSFIFCPSIRDITLILDALLQKRDKKSYSDSELQTLEANLTDDAREKLTALLPPECGSSTLTLSSPTFVGQTFNVDLVDVQSHFDYGFVSMAGHVESTALCVELNAEFTGRLDIKAVAGTLVTTADFTPGVGRLNVDWYCQLGAWLFGPTSWDVAGSYVLQYMQTQLNTFLNQLRPPLQSAIDPGTVPSFWGDVNFGFSLVSLDEILIYPKILTFSLKATVPVPPHPIQELTIQNLSVGYHLVSVYLGVYVVDSGCMQGSYPYEEFGTENTASYMADAVLMIEPISYEWSVSVDGSSYTTLDKNSIKYVSQSAVNTQYGAPPPDGSIVPQNVTIGYVVANNTLSVKVPPQGNFPAWVKVVASDAIGKVREASIALEVFGDNVGMGAQYLATLVACFNKLRGEFINPTVVRIPPWLPADHPAPEEVDQFFGALLKAGSPEAFQMFRYARLAHGNSYQHALFSRQISITESAQRARALERLGR